MPKLTVAELAAAPPFKDRYEEWCRIQYQMAHHDIWWVKAQQMTAANWTVALLGALFGLAGLVDHSCGSPFAELSTRRGPVRRR